MRFVIDTEQEKDGRWIAEITNVPGVLVYGETEQQAKANAYALALRVIADQVQESCELPQSISVASATA
jgi:predicted RNase H-like HicB family nuclease